MLPPVDDETVTTARLQARALTDRTGIDCSVPRSLPLSDYTAHELGKLTLRLFADGLFSAENYCERESARVIKECRLMYERLNPALHLESTNPLELKQQTLVRKLAERLGLYLEHRVALAHFVERLYRLSRLKDKELRRSKNTGKCSHKPKKTKKL